ncbi:PREDICTED: cytochrome c oxidase subunit 6A, mitochondrial isoform X1 [Poecilia mexicana]|uniref:cytochrome c oxidase subunit 6A, mitochondrial isoform X1 n=1 Tax=Poecilia mexicana TaxID=48701 RepID=UPI00072EE3D2|nr:PREDICTED: cytochrome c oxidase subunit 6A, mitochondrial isoform X1 [Poecilia mexicana]XP_014862155.1 PREDICTED: cytochrome c oxidase subunit 6A, mitochondrial isoform X1 [Poecilia mexicana]XP_014862156.1 PREDICTED: cytochrome c oxidase subunit 6A, mitochondrial isoform X1 [Poecilia mexicana]
MSLSPVALAARRALAAASHSSHEGGAAKTWKILTIVVAFPGVGVCMANAFMKAQEHEQPEFVPYSHLRIRSKKYPWGDGNHTLFHNSHANALPDGYEGSDH